MQQYIDRSEQPEQKVQTEEPSRKEPESMTGKENREMETVQHNGLEMIGIIRVPSCGIELPVLGDWSYTLLEYAPCRYTGNIYDGNLVLMGHNYSSHFKPLKKVEIGETVEFEDVNGVVWRYSVEEIDSVHRNDVDSLPSAHELILFTCEEYNVYRFVVRCSFIGKG